MTTTYTLQSTSAGVEESKVEISRNVCTTIAGVCEQSEQAPNAAIAVLGDRGNSSPPVVDIQKTCGSPTCMDLSRGADGARRSEFEIVLWFFVHR